MYICFESYILGTTYFSIRNNRLYTNTRIDHDTKAPGPQMAARVQCQVTQRHNSVIQLRERILHFTVLDRNDNLPELHTPANNISVTLDNPYFHNVSLFLSCNFLIAKIISSDGKHHDLAYMLLLMSYWST